MSDLVERAAHVLATNSDIDYRKCVVIADAMLEVADLSRLRAENERLTGENATIRANRDAMAHGEKVALGLCAIENARAKLAEKRIAELEGEGEVDRQTAGWSEAFQIAIHHQDRADTATRALSDLRARIEKPSAATIEKLARGIVSVWYGGFEDQTEDANGKWHPGTPNDHARNLIRSIIRALSQDITLSPGPVSGGETVDG